MGLCGRCFGTVSFFTSSEGVVIPRAGSCTCGRASGAQHSGGYGAADAVPVGRENWPAYAGYRHGLRQLAMELGYTLIVRTYCWDCGEEVYLVCKADGGFTIVEEVGGGWTPHPCYRSQRSPRPSSPATSSSGWTTVTSQPRPPEPSLLVCHPDYRVPVPAGLRERHDLADGEELRATIVGPASNGGHPAWIVCDGRHLYRVVLRGDGKLGQCVEGALRRRGQHWELHVSRVVHAP